MRASLLVLAAACLHAALAPTAQAVGMLRGRRSLQPAAPGPVERALAAGYASATAYLSTPCGRDLAAQPPLLKGFQGRMFRFPVTNEGAYNIISEKNHQLNCQLRQGSRACSPSHFQVTSCMFKHRDDRVLVSREPGGQLTTVQANGAALGAATSRQLPGGANITLHRSTAATATTCADMDRVVITTPHMSVVLLSLPDRLDVLLLDVSRYLCDMHGVLGQTYQGVHSTTTQAPFAVEGAPWDYEVNDLLDDKFTFNRFRSGAGCGHNDGTPGGPSAALQRQQQ